MSKKQIMEKKKVINLIGVLDKNEEGDYTVTVEDKDETQTYTLNDILSEIEGNIISISSEEIF